MRYASDLSHRYNPLYFLASVGAGGLAVSFFMYLMWLTPHKGSPIPSFASFAAAWGQGDPLIQALIVVGLTGVATFAVLHVRLLAWNLKQFAAWKRTPAYAALKTSNGETQLMAMPLTLAMTVNVAFIVGALFVPGLWEAREGLFPLAVAAFAAIGVWAMRLFLDFFARVLTKGGFDCAKNNSLGQMLSVFAFSMVGVGFSASAAMSHVKPVVVVAYLGAVLFVAAAIVMGLIQLVLGFRAMMEHAANEETTPTLWIVIPILTVVGIAIYRLKMSLAHNFATPVSDGEAFAFLAIIVALQVFFGLLGWAVMRRAGYFEKWVTGPARSAGSYALICPGVALFVSGNFLLNVGLVRLGVVEPLSVAHAALYVPLVALQALTVWLFFKLNGKLLGEDRAAPTKGALPQAAE